MSDINPWADETWNETAQAEYIRKFGRARAEARARDAGTILGTPRKKVIIHNRPGGPGARGRAGDTGWSPVFAVATDGVRRVLQVTDWAGGTGTKPATGKYVGVSGLVTLIADGVNIRGPSGGGEGGALTIRDIAAATISKTDLVLDTAEVLRANTGVLGFYANDNNVLKYILFTTVLSLRYLEADYFKAKMFYGVGSRG